MKIQTINSTSFGIKFQNNYALKETINYAKSINKGDVLDRAINILESEGERVVTIEHGINSQKKAFSSFCLDDIKVSNTPYDSESAVHTTLRAILDLSTFGGRYRALTNSTRLFRPYGE